MLRSEVTSRSGTTVPDEVREALGVRPGEDALVWEIRGDEVVVRRAGRPAGAEHPPAALAHCPESEPAEPAASARKAPDAPRSRLLDPAEGITADLDQWFDGPIPR
jgi:bifunctional DNA-binding transcriptional regulator/antitoxin component of YhaV-PrlF toxin-antitoxin module